MAHMSERPIDDLEDGLDELSRIAPKELMLLLADFAERAQGYFEATCQEEFLFAPEELRRALTSLRSFARGRGKGKRIDLYAAALAAEASGEQLRQRIVTTVYNPQAPTLEAATLATSLPLEAAVDMDENLEAIIGVAYQARRAAGVQSVQELAWQAARVQQALIMCHPPDLGEIGDRLRPSLLAAS